MPFNPRRVNNQSSGRRFVVVAQAPAPLDTASAVPTSQVAPPLLDEEREKLQQELSLLRNHNRILRDELNRQIDAVLELKETHVQLNGAMMNELQRYRNLCDEYAKKNQESNQQHLEAREKYEETLKVLAEKEQQLETRLNQSPHALLEEPAPPVEVVPESKVPPKAPPAPLKPNQSAKPKGRDGFAAPTAARATTSKSVLPSTAASFNSSATPLPKSASKIPRLKSVASGIIQQHRIAAASSKANIKDVPLSLIHI